MSVAMSAPFAMFRRCSISSSGTSAPCAVSWSIAPRCICQTSRMSGRSPRTSSKRVKCSGDSTMSAIAPESSRIHWICDGELVS